MNTATTSESHPVAYTILQQLGNMAVRMLGANSFLGSATSLTFKIGHNAKSVSHLRITLEPSDTYKVEAIRVRRIKGILTSKVVETREDVYVDSLHKTIETLTGLYTKL
jgi:hypothetical protein